MDMASTVTTVKKMDRSTTELLRESFMRSRIILYTATQAMIRVKLFNSETNTINSFPAGMEVGVLPLTAWVSVKLSGLVLNLHAINIPQSNNRIETLYPSSVLLLINSFNIPNPITNQNVLEPAILINYHFYTY